MTRSYRLFSQKDAAPVHKIGRFDLHPRSWHRQGLDMGCVALENDDIKELFDVVEVGTPVTIVH